ncbi:MAG: sigma-E processing peptidase SpoIIGA [Clostridia bacterium]|nr:sigma-E processing peptidase SpoIIGA [Clostridia bacterium]
MEVYADLYFLINASMDFLCLTMSGKLLHRRSGMPRLLLGACLGGLYALAALLFGLGGAVGLLADLGAATVLSMTVFFTYGMRFWRVLQSAAVYVLVSMVMGGIMSGLYTLLNRLDLPFEALQGDTVSVWVLGMLALVAGIATSRGGRMLGFSQKTRHVTVEAILFGRRVELSAIVDSGNLLRDPISGRGVIVADRARLSGILPQSLLQGADVQNGALTDWLERSPTYAARVRLIPASGAFGTGLLVAILPDRLTVTEGRERYEADYLVAISRLGDGERDFDAVVPLA